MTKAILSDIENNFTLYIIQPVYKYIKVPKSVAYIRNKKTGENIGTELELIEYKYDTAGQINPNPKKEEDCYEIVSI